MKQLFSHIEHPQLILIVIAALTVATISSCTTGQRDAMKNKTYSFVEVAKTDPKFIQLSDQKALIFSDNVASAFRAKAGTSRYIREGSSSAQVTLSALAGADPALNFSKSALTALGFGSSLIPQFQGIFNAKGRAEAYTDAVRLIESAQNEFLAYNQNPSASELTQNGVTLIQRTQASIHVVENVLAGRVPSPVEMKQATEAMSSNGAKITAAGSAAFNHVSAEGEKVISKSQFPGMSQPGDYNPSDKSANTQKTPVDVQADQMEISKWVTNLIEQKDQATLRQFVRGGGYDPSLLTDKQSASSAREMIRSSTTRTTVDKLIELKAAPLDATQVDKNKYIQPAKVTEGEKQKPGFPGMTNEQ